MCVTGMEAIALAGLAASAAGTVVNTSAQNSQARQVVRAREDAARREGARQNAYRDEAAAAYQNAQPQVMPTNEPQERQQAADARVAQIQQTTPTTGAAPSALPVGGPPQVQDELARRLRMAESDASNETRRRANLAAYDTTLFNRNLGIQRAGGQIDMLNNFSRGSANIFPGTLQTAENNVYARGLPIWGDLLGTAGRLGVMYGTSRPLTAPGALLGQHTGSYRGP